MRDLELCPGLLIEVQVAVNPAEFDEEEIHEMQQQACDDEDARPHLQLRASMGLGALWFLVAFGSRHAVGDGQPKCQTNVEQEDAEQHDFEHLDDDVGTHEVAEDVVPCAAVVAQDAEVGAGVEQQEQAKESAQQGHEDFLADGMDFGEIHRLGISDRKSTGFS